MNHSDPKNYKICIKDHLSTSWSNWFDDLKIDHQWDRRGVPITVISGYVPDQSALHGIFSKIQNLGLIILYVKQED